MTRWNRALAALVAMVLVVLAACSGGDSNEPDCDAIAAALVSRIEISPSAATVNLGDSLQLAATAYSCAGALNGVTTFAWRSANAGVATVSATGLVKAVASGGPVAIFAEAQGKEGSSAISTRPVPVDRVTVEPATATVGVNRTSTLTVRAFDAQDREILGRPVTWSSANPAIVSVNQSGGITGVAPGGPVLVTATIEGKSDASQVSVVLVAVNTVTVAPTTATIAAGTTQLFTATLRDELGNVLAGRAVNWTSSEPTIATIGGADGVALGLRPGTVTITATSEGRSGTAQLTVNIGAAARLAFVQQPSAVQAGSAIAPAVTVEIQDAAGNRVTTGSPTVTLGLTPGGATLGGNTATASNGLATFSALTVSTAGTFSLTASSTGLTGTTSSAFVVTARPATRLGFVQQPTIDTAGKAITPPITVELQNDAGGRVTTSGVNITIALGTNPGSSTLGGTLTRATVSGVATFADLTLDRTGTGYTLTASAAAAGLAPATSSAFNILPGAPASLRVVSQPCPDACTAGSPLTPAPAFEILDANANRVTSGTGSAAVVTVALVGGPASALSGTRSVAAVNGLATFSNLSISRTDNDYTLAASVSTPPGITGVSTDVFSIRPGDGSLLSITTAIPSSVVSGSALPTVSVQLLDADSNLVTTAGVSVSLSISPSGTLVPQTPQLTNASGVATFTNVVVSAAAGSGYTLIAAATGFANGSSNEFAVTVPSVTLTVTTAGDGIGGVTSVPAGAIACGTAGSDCSETVPAGTSVTLAASAATGSAFSGWSGGGCSGTGTCVVTLSAATVVTATFALEPGELTTLAFGQQPTDEVAGVSIAPAVTVVALDAGSNPFANATVTLSVVTGPGGASLNDATAITNASGVATFSGLDATVAGTYTIRASSGGVQSSPSASFDIGPSAPVALAIRTQPTGGTAGGLVTPAVQVEVLDAFGNIVTSYTDQVVLDVNTGPVGGSVSNNSTSAVAGIATFGTLTASTEGSYTLVAAATGLTSAVTNEFPVVAASSGGARQLGFLVQPSNVDEDEAISPAVRVEVRDANGGRVTTSTATVMLVFGVNAGGATLSGNAARASSGVATFSNLRVSRPGNGYTLIAASDGLQSATSTTFRVRQN